MKLRAPSKKDLRNDLDAEVEAFLQDGGNISEVERGKSGLDHAKPWINPFKSSESEKAQSRTPVPEVVAAIDLRKQSKTSKSARPKRAEKRWIYDDFGEPLRWEWVDNSK
jgi:hypothetical protein